MRVVEIQGRFGLEQLRSTERPDPEPGPGQVTVRMHAASLNYRDLLTVLGHYNPKQSLPLIPCSDGVGRIVEVGEGVTGWRPGDRVATVFAQGWISGEPTHAKLRSILGGPLDGTLAELMVLDANGVVAAPEHLSDAQAATLPCAAVTAWNALTEQGPVRPGETVLIQGTGGVSIFALQFAKLAGARTLVTSSSDEKLERARELGADETLNYRETPRWSGWALDKTDGRGVDHVVEVGGAGTLPESLKAVRFGGHVAMIGVLSGAASELSVVPVLMKQIRIGGVLVGHRESFEAMNRAITTHRLQPVVDRRFPLDEVRPALECLAAGQHFGKICIRVAGDE